MDNDVSAGSTTRTTGAAGTTSAVTAAGRLALALTLLAFGLGHTGVVDGVTPAGAVSIAHYLGGVALFAVGLLAFRDRDTAAGTAFTVLGALWFTWAVSAGAAVSDNAAGLFLLLFALVALTLTLTGGDQLGQGTYGLLFLAFLLLALGAFADSDVLAKAGGWAAVASGAVAWYAATAALAHWPTTAPRRAARRRVTATG